MLTSFTLHLCAWSPLILYNPMDCSPPGFSVHEIILARILVWVAIPFSRGIFPTQGSNPSLLQLLHWQVHSLPLSHLKALCPCPLHAISWLWALVQAFLGPSRLGLTSVYQSANAAITKYHRLVVHRYIFSHNSWGQKSPEFFRALEGKNQGVAGLVSTEASLLDSEMLSSSCVFLCVCLCPTFFFL